MLAQALTSLAFMPAAFSFVAPLLNVNFGPLQPVIELVGPNIKDMMKTITFIKHGALFAAYHLNPAAMLAKLPVPDVKPPIRKMAKFVGSILKKVLFIKMLKK